MSNYSVTTNFGAKDGLVSGNPLKLIVGAQFTTEFNNIVTAIATKVDGSTVLFPDGTASTPSVGFTNNGNTGLYNVAGALNFATSGVQRLVLSTTGALTINAPTSGTALTVTGASGSGLFTSVVTTGTTAGDAGLSVVGANATGILIRVTTSSAATALLVGGNGNITMSGGLGINGLAAFGGDAGWGTPTGTTLTTNFPGATATLLQTSQSLARVILILKNFGLLFA